MEQVYNEERLVGIARRVGFIERSTSRLRGDDFVKLLTTEMLTLPTISLPGMCDILRKINPAADMSPQALGERINNERAVDYLSEVLRFAVEKNLSIDRESGSPREELRFPKRHRYGHLFGPRETSLPFDRVPSSRSRGERANKKGQCQRPKEGQRAERIKSLAYGRLIAIVTMNILYGFASWYSQTHLKRETSLHKLIEWLKRRERMSRAALLSQFHPLLSNLIQDLSSMICRKKRKRKTTQELIESLTPYGENFLAGNQQLAA
jgi:hypothetical protein